MKPEITPILYDPAKNKVAAMSSEYEVRDAENMAAPKNELYLALVHVKPEEKYVEFYRVLGKSKEGKVIVTTHFTENASEDYLEQFVAAISRSEFAFLLEDEQPAAQTEDDTVALLETDSTPKPKQSTWAVETQDQGSQKVADDDAIDNPLPKSPYLKMQSASEEEDEEVEIEPDVVSEASEPQYEPTSTPSFSGAGNTQQKKRGGGLFSGLFGKKQQSVGKIYFFGNNNEVMQAQGKIRTVLEKAGVSRIPFDEIITVNKLMDAIKAEQSMMFVVDRDRFTSMGGGDLLNVLAEHNLPVVDIKTVNGMGDAQILSYVQNVHEIDLKSVLYTKQRIILFLSTTGGVGKTTLSLNMASWLSQRSANVLYMEVLGGAGVDELMDIRSTRLEEVLEGIDSPKPVGGKGSKLYVAALDNNTSTVIGRTESWREFFDRIVLPQTARPYYHAMVVDTYSQMISTRYLLKYATDVVVVSDMRETTSVITKDTMENVLALAGRSNDRRFYVVHNRYNPAAPNVERRLSRLKAELDTIAEAQKVRLEHIVVPRTSSVEDTILIKDEKERAKILGNLLEKIYGVKAA